MKSFSYLQYLQKMLQLFLFVFPKKYQYSRIDLSQYIFSFYDGDLFVPFSFSQTNEITSHQIILQLTRSNTSMATATKKSNILYIESDSDASSQQPNQSTSTPSNLRLQGNFKLQGNRIGRNILEGPTSNEEYYFQQIHLAKRNRRTGDNEVIAFDQNPEHQISTSSNQYQNKKKEALEQNEDRDYEVDKSEEDKDEETPRAEAKKKTSKLLNFNLEDSSSEEQVKESEEEAKQRDAQKQEEEIVERASDSELQNEGENMVQEQDNEQMVFSNTGQKDTKEEESSSSKIPPVDMVQYSNKYNFSRTKIDEKHFLDGEINLQNHGLNYLYPQFDLTFKGYNTHILSCKKQSGSIGANYYISTDQQNLEKNQNYLGKVRSSNETDTYNIFDNGERLVEKSKFSGFFNSKKRELVATVCLEIGTGPRKMEVFMLKENTMYSTLSGTVPGSEIGLNKLYNVMENKNKIYHFESRKPEWLPQFGKYFLNFNGKVRRASIRNFVLEESESKKKVLLFGKEKNNQYNIQIWDPIPPWVAMGIIITQFQKNE